MKFVLSITLFIELPIVPLLTVRSTISKEIVDAMIIRVKALEK